eukprot:scaffold289336_cov31-Tisochrysis_lutea.AAC.1
MARPSKSTGSEHSSSSEKSEPYASGRRSWVKQLDAATLGFPINTAQRSMVRIGRGRGSGKEVIL